MCDVDYCTGNCLGCRHTREPTEVEDVLARFMEELRKPDW